jgi:hypothetical protein
MRVMKRVKTSTLMTMNVEIVLYPTFGQYYAAQTADGYEFVRCDPVEPDINIRTCRSPRYSAWEVRRDFLDPSNVGLQDFVDLYGRFASEEFDLTTPNHRDWFRRCKDFVRKLDTTPIPDWRLIRKDFPELAILMDLTLPYDLEWRTQYTKNGSATLLPVGRLSFRTALEAMVASVQIDKASGTEFGICSECGREFEKTSRHQRSYHTPECGAALRQRRRRDRKRIVSPAQALSGQNGKDHS